MNSSDCIIYGLGYIGLPTAVYLASKDIKVYGLDVDKKLVENINNGKINTTETGLNEMLSIALQNNKFKAGTYYLKSDIHIIVVPTPFKNNNEPDISIVEDVAKKLTSTVKEGDLIILESTSPVGTTEKVAKIIYDDRKDLKDKLYFAYCPERVLPGQIFQELKDNDRVIGGINLESSNKAKLFYEKFVDGRLHLTDCRTAEMCKLVENASRDVQIAFANELSIICNKADINVWKLIDLANRHPRVDILSPGCGVGGHCIAVDPYFIYSQFPLESKIIGQAREINNYKTFWCYEKIQEEVNNLQKNKVDKVKLGIFGLTFKPDIDDIRQSPALEIAQKVFNTYGPNVSIVEPNLSQIDEFKLTNYDIAYDESDIVVFLVNHSKFKELKININKKKVLDFCGLLK
jgi:UDP-N-acetyl-D-mannosaminuronic acid dehydrogenase